MFENKSKFVTMGDINENRHWTQNIQITCNKFLTIENVKVIQKKNQRQPRENAQTHAYLAHMSYDPYCFSLWFLFLHLSIWRRQTSSTKWMEKIESEMFRTKYDPEEMTHTHYFFVSRKLWMFVYICIVSISIIIFNQKKKTS